MALDTWDRIQSLFLSAADLSPEEQARFLDSACANDAELRREVESLLAADLKQGENILTAVKQEAALLFDSEALVGQRLGAYRVEREVGRGGMGAVYLAVRDDDQYRKQVAIKVIKRGMDTMEMLQRFRHERQILANFDHPSIARLLDAGTTLDGRPFFVMDYVEGVPLDVFCRERMLDVKARCELFLRILDAVAYAHRNLVVHRDLKPGNIFVTADGSPKLLDFGVAKLLRPDAERGLTATIAALPLTPEYASPEQVRGLNVTTAADIYSLGAVLFELLTGQRAQPMTTLTPVELERVVCDTEVRRPSLLARGIDSDLDNIVLMAMRKEPERRYGSVAEFAEDIRRHLHGLPVHAREDTLGYRGRKFIRRHRMGVAAAVLLVAILSTGVAVSTIEARRAQRRFDEVRRIAHAVLYDIHDAIRDLPGSLKAREVIVNTALQYLDGLAREAGGDPGIQLELAEAYERVGNVQGNATSRSLGKTVEALGSYRKAMRIADDLASRHPDLAKANLIRMRIRILIAAATALRGNLTAALELYREGEQIGEAIALREPENRDNLKVLATLYEVASREEPDTERAIASARKSVAIRERLAVTHPEGDESQEALANSYSALQTALARTRRTGEILTLALRTLRIRETLAAAQPLNARYQRNLGVDYSKVADELVAAHRAPEGLEYQRKALAVAAAQAAADPMDRPAAFVHGLMLLKTDTAMPQDKGHDAALVLLRESTAIFQSLVASDPGDAKMARNLAAVRLATSRRLVRAGDPAAALRMQREAIRIAEGLVKKDPKDMVAIRYLALGYGEAAPLLAKAHQRNEAIDAARKNIAISEAARVIDPANTVTQSWLPKAYATAGLVDATLASAADAPVAQRRADWNQAREFYEKSVAAWGQIGSDWTTQQNQVRAEVKRCAAAAAALSR